MKPIDREKKEFFPAGNRTPVSRVTGGDTHLYTTEDLMANLNYFINKATVPLLPKVGVQQHSFSF